jgi:hypothetical protein
MSMTFDRRARSALANVIATARRELADRDVDDVPARLRKVAASSARSLPPPLEKALVDALVADDEFRDAVARRWADDEEDDLVGSIFLDAPDRAAPLIARIADADELGETRELLDRARAEVADLTGRLKEARTRTASAADRARADVAALKAADKAARRTLERAANEATSDLEAARIRLEQQDGLLAAADERVALLEASIERRAARERRRSQPAPGSRPISGPPSRDPQAIAAAIDAWERALRPYRAPRAEAASESERRGLVVPPGVAPDAPEALDGLIEQGIELVVVDGYNVAGAHIGEGFAGPEGRAAVEQLATTLSRRARAPVTVWFDAIGVDGRPSFATDIGVEIRFAKDHSADDAIVDDVRRTTARVVVITNDRELRERTAAEGAVAVWSDALIAWANR